MVGVFIGVAVAVLTIVFAQVTRGQRWVYSLGLLTLPSLYASFALRIGEQPLVFKEMIYGIPFIVVGLVFALVSSRYSTAVVGAFWIIHGLYDVMHTQFFTNPGVPGWYPAFCFTVDVVIGAYLLWLSRRISHANLHQA